MALPLANPNNAATLNATWVYIFQVLYESSFPAAMSFGSSEEQVVTYTILTSKGVQTRAINYF